MQPGTELTEGQRSGKAGALWRGWRVVCSGWGPGYAGSRGYEGSKACLGPHPGALQQPMSSLANLRQEDTASFYKKKAHDQNLFSLDVLADSGKDGEGRASGQKWGSQEETLPCNERGASSLTWRRRQDLWMETSRRQVNMLALNWGNVWVGGPNLEDIHGK